MDMTPEECFERSMKLIEHGKTDKAIKLLQIATLRAPGEGRYREALQTARLLKESRKAPPAEAAPEAAPAGMPSTETETASSLADASAEEIYQRAMALRDDGDIERASRMMQAAAAKDPRATKYREGIDSLRHPGGVSSSVGEEKLTHALQRSSYDEVEHLLRETLREKREQPAKLQLLALLLLRVRDDPSGALGPARESVRLAPRRLPGLVLLEDILRAKGDRAEAKRITKSIQDITTDADRLERARRQLNDAIPVPGARHAAVAQTAAAPPKGRGQVALIATLVVLCSLLAGIWFMKQPSIVDITPYQGQPPVISASTPAQDELSIRIEEAAWKALESDAKEARLRGVMTEAAAQGYQVVFIKSEQGTLLGSARGGQTFIPK